MMKYKTYEASPKDVAAQIVAEMIIATLGKPTITNEQAKACAIVAATEMGIKGDNKFFDNVIEEIKAL